MGLIAMEEPRLFDRPQTSFVGLETAFISILSTEADTSPIPKLWEIFGPRSGEVPHRTGADCFGVIRGLPDNERSHPDELRYLCAVAVSKLADPLPEGMVAWTLPAARFAGFLHRGPIWGIGQTVGGVYEDWLPQAPYRHSSLADIELYDERFEPESETSVMEYWISIEPEDVS